MNLKQKLYLGTLIIGIHYFPYRFIQNCMYPELYNISSFIGFTGLLILCLDGIILVALVCYLLEEIYNLLGK